jgi:hypothetical protein
MDFEPIFSPDAVRVVLRHESARHRMIVAAYGVILASSKAELMSYLQRTPARATQAPELLSWLLKHGQGETPEAKLLRGAAVRLAIVLNELGAMPVIH